MHVICHGDTKISEYKTLLEIGRKGWTPFSKRKITKAVSSYKYKCLHFVLCTCRKDNHVPVIKLSKWFCNYSSFILSVDYLHNLYLYNLESFFQLASGHPSFESWNEAIVTGSQLCYQRIKRLVRLLECLPKPIFRN